MLVYKIIDAFRFYFAQILHGYLTRQGRFARSFAPKISKNGNLLRKNAGYRDIAENLSVGKNCVVGNAC